MEIHRSNLKDNKRKNIGNSDSFSSTKSQPSKYSTISLAPDLSKLNPNCTKRKRNASCEIHKQKIFDYEDRLLNKKSCSSTKSIKDKKDINSPSKLNKKSSQISVDKPRIYKKTKGYLPPKLPRDLCKKTLVLDLDETIIHSWFTKIKSPDIQISVSIKGMQSDVYAMVRPGAFQFLLEMEKLYEVVFFTASISSYAIPLIKSLDRNNYGYRMLFREHCVLKNGRYVKDLSKIGRNLNDVILIDNTPYVYHLQKSNALPISSWFDDQSDTELQQLIPLLRMLTAVSNVRNYIKRIVKGNRICYEKVNSFLTDFYGEEKEEKESGDGDIYKHFIDFYGEGRNVEEGKRGIGNGERKKVESEGCVLKKGRRKWRKKVKRSKSKTPSTSPSSISMLLFPIPLFSISSIFTSFFSSNPPSVP